VIYQIKIDNFNSVLKKVEEAALIAESEENELDKNGVIHRFEFTVKMLWKASKVVLNY